MKTIAAMIVTVLTMMGSVYAQKQPQGVTYDTQIIRVSDGDTIVISARFLPAPLKPELAVRIFGVDTPEKGHRAQCPSEAQRGEAASAWTKQLVASGQKFQVTLYGWDKFGGRVLGDILVDGQSVRQGLLKNGLAREYYGETKQSWCQ
jgi:endonuclease YncB( thermonuclease family)